MDSASGFCSTPKGVIFSGFILPVSVQNTPFGVVKALQQADTFVSLENLHPYKLLCMLWLMSAACLQAQNLENVKNIGNVKKQKPVVFGGSLGIGFSYYNSNSPVKRTAPYNWYVSGSPSVRIYGLQVPFSFTYSETGRSLTHPFVYNFSGASPYYKWATTHIGFRSMNFSEYTMSGVVFNGAGIELKPGKLRFAAFYGVFNPAVEADTGNGNFGVILPAYKRIGYGAKLGLGSDNNYFDLIYFRGKDDAASLKRVPAFETIKPVDNVTFGPRFRFTLFKHWFVESDLALSIFTRNILNDTLKETEDLLTVYKFVRVNTTTYGAFAGHVSSGLRFSKWGISGRVRQISSDFQSLGINLLQDDIREYTVNPNFSLFKSKLSIGGSYGIYTDNVSGKRINTTVRNILNTNVSINPSNKLMLGLAYSNFGTTRNNGLLQMNDSITFSIINESYNGNISYNFGTAKKPFVFSLFGLYQSANDRNIFTRQYNNSQVLNVGLNSQYKFDRSKLQLSGGLAYAAFTVAAQQFSTQSAQFGFRKSMQKDKLNMGINFNYTMRFNAGETQGDVVSVNYSLQTRLGKRHSLQTQIRLMRNSTGIISNSAFNDQRISLSYGFSI